MSCRECLIDVLIHNISGNSETEKKRGGGGDWEGRFPDVGKCFPTLFPLCGTLISILLLTAARF